MDNYYRYDDEVKDIPINSMQLAQLIRENEVIYNPNTIGKGNTFKSRINAWLNIFRAINPDYDTLNAAAKKDFENIVRKRWKSLRDTYSREVKKMMGGSNRQFSPLMNELKYLTPFLKYKNPALSSIHEELTNYLGLNEDENKFSYQDDSVEIAQENDSENLFKRETEFMDDASQFIETVELKEEETEPSDPKVNACSTPLASNDKPDAFVKDHTPLKSWSGGFCTMSELRGEEFVNTHFISPETVEHIYDSSTNEASNSTKKRPASNVIIIDDVLPKQPKRSAAAERIEVESPQPSNSADDEDRMFLLSLLPDLKRVPTMKKVLLKAEIVTSLARAMQP